MKLIEILLNEVLGSPYSYKESIQEPGGGLPREHTYKWQTDDEYSYEMRIHERTMGSKSPFFEIDFTVRAEEDEHGELTNVPSKGGQYSGFPSFMVMTKANDPRVFGTIVDICLKFVKLANQKYPNGFALGFSGAHGSEDIENDGSVKAGGKGDKRERVYKGLVTRVARQMRIKNMVMVDKSKTRSGMIELRFNGWEPKQEN